MVAPRNSPCLSSAKTAAFCRALRACLETTRGAVFGEKPGWRGTTKEALRAATTEQLRRHSRAGRSQTAFSPKTLRAAGLLSVAGVDSFLTSRYGTLRAAMAALATAKIPRRSAPRSFATGSQAKGVDRPLRLGASLTEAVKGSLAVRIIGEDGLAAVSAVHHVIDGTRICRAQLATHADWVPGQEAIGQ